MSKLNRERKVLEKRMEKQARKELRKLAAAEPPAETPEGPQPPASAADTG
jgi:hypothetical protein